MSNKIIRPFNNSIFQEEDKNVNEFLSFEEEETKQNEDPKHKQENKQIEQDIK